MFLWEQQRWTFFFRIPQDYILLKYLEISENRSKVQSCECLQNFMTLQLCAEMKVWVLLRAREDAICISKKLKGANMNVCCVVFTMPRGEFHCFPPYACFNSKCVHDTSTEHEKSPDISYKPQSVIKAMFKCLMFKCLNLMFKCFPGCKRLIFPPWSEEHATWHDFIAALGLKHVIENNYVKVLNTVFQNVLSTNFCFSNSLMTCMKIYQSATFFQELGHKPINNQKEQSA